MKKNFLFIFKLLIIVFFSLIWVVLIQAEYEMITKPELQNDFPLIKEWNETGVGCSCSVIK